MLRSTSDFLKLYMFPYHEISKVVKCKILLNISNKHPKMTLKYQISEKGSGSYECLKFRAMHQIGYRLLHHNYVIMVTSQNISVFIV